MILIFKYQWRQIYNFWRQLGLRVQVEILILFVVFFSFFTDKFTQLFLSWLSRPEVTPAGLAGFIIPLILIAAVFFTPLIYLNLIPKQRGLVILGCQPLSAQQAFMVLFFMFLKYQLIILLIMFPVFTAIALSSGIWLFFYSLILFFVFLIASLLLIHQIGSENRKTLVMLSIYYLISVFYFTIYFLLYQTTDLAHYFELAVIMLAAGWLVKNGFFARISLDQLLGKERFTFEPSARKISGYSVFKFARFIPAPWRPLWKKEILSYTRNRKYRRLKIISLFVFIVILLAIGFYYPGNYLAAVSVLAFIFIWEHYSHQFSEKYVSGDPAAFYKTLPLKYHHVLLSKFFSEFVFILFLVGIIFLVGIFQGSLFYDLLILCLMILIVAALILYFTILIRLIFFDRPRFAGYAYHLIIIFLLVMNLTYYLVGPIITLTAGIYINIISYRQFAR